MSAAVTFWLWVVGVVAVVCGAGGMIYAAIAAAEWVRGR